MGNNMPNERVREFFFPLITLVLSIVYFFKIKHYIYCNGPCKRIEPNDVCILETKRNQNVYNL